MPHKDPEEGRRARRRYYLANRQYLLQRQAERRAADPTYMIEYRQTHRDQMAQARSVKLAKRRAYVAKLKAGPCVDCGGTFPPECMDFDHVRGEKHRDVSKMLTGKTERLHEELEKCDLVCANCHRIRTHRRRLDSRSHSREKGAA